jgi:selenide,water dikinase
MTEQSIARAAGGCASKLSPGELSGLMRRLGFAAHADLLVGPEHGSDAGVYRLSADIAIVQSADFFPPMLAHAHTFGRIAATNAVSDVYALGARPVTALNLLCIPRSEDYDSVVEVLEGAREVVESAGAVVAGGHTITGPQLQFGLSVTGVAHPARIIRNTTPEAGDVLVLTKPLGTGVLVHAYHHGALGEGSAADAALAPAIESMTTLNRRAAELMVELGAHAATDITGFGVFVHALDMLSVRPLGMELDWAAFPLLPRVADLAAGNICGGTQRNGEYVRSRRTAQGDPAIEMHGTDPALAELALSDAQTSGGLLIALPENAAQELLAGLSESGYLLAAAIVGRVTGQHPGQIVVE